MSLKHRGPLVLVTSSFPISSDGSEAAGSFVADLAHELGKHIAVRVVAPGRNAAREHWSDGIEVFRYISPARPLSQLQAWRPDDLYWIMRTLRGGLNATRAAVTDDVTHVLALWGLPCGEWARRATRERGIGYSVWMLGSDVWSLGRVPFLRSMLHRVIRHSTRAYADGYLLAEDARRIGGRPVEFLPSTRTINLIDPPPPRQQPPYRLLFLGRWHPNKGVDLLLDALKLLDDEDWSHIARVEIQGGGPLDAQVYKAVAELQKLGRPVQAGRFLTKSEAEVAIVSADWILIPSRIESIPVVFSDAMKLGRPVVATPVGDLPRLVAGEPACGVLAEAGTAMAIAAAMRKATATTTLDYQLGVRTQAAAFALPTIATRIVHEVAHHG